MRSKQPFARRILIAFVLMTVIVSGAFAIGVVAVVQFVEEYLVSNALQRELNAVQEDIMRGQAPRLSTGTQFFTSHISGPAIPERYAGLKEGFNEVVTSDEAFYVYVQAINNQTYLLVQEQHEFEAREQVLFNVVLAGFLLSVLGAWGLGLIMAQKVMAPISRLAQQVRHRNQQDSEAPPLAPQYPNDEIGQLAAAFDCTLSQIRQSLERERLFTSDVSHELRTPLMIITTSCELLAEATLGQRKSVQIERITRASEEMTELVQTFLKLARDNTNESISTANRSLSVIAAEQVERWAPQFEAKHLDFQYVEEAKDDGAYNPVFLSTVISNLLRNAVHYTTQGFVRLVSGNGEFCVEDSGSGIAVDQHEKIFQPFVRGPQTRGEGLGLGLSLVKRICCKQGWTISVHNLPGGGTRFKVILKSIN